MSDSELQEISNPSDSNKEKAEGKDQKESSSRNLDIEGFVSEELEEEFNEEEDEKVTMEKTKKSDMESEEIVEPQKVPHIQSSNPKHEPSKLIRPMKMETTNEDQPVRPLTNNLLRVLNDLQNTKDLLELTRKELELSQRTYNVTLADKEVIIQYFENMLDQVEKERDSLKGQLKNARDELETFRKTQVNNSLERTSSSPQDIFSEHLMKIHDTQNKIELSLKNHRIQDLEAENSELRKWKDLAQLENQNKKLMAEMQDQKKSLEHLGIPVFRNNVISVLDEYNKNYFTKESVNLDKDSILEVTSIMVKKLHEMEKKLRHYEEFQLEERLKTTLQRNTVLEQQLQQSEATRKAILDENKELKIANETLKLGLEHQSQLVEDSKNLRKKLEIMEDQLQTQTLISKELEVLVMNYEEVIRDLRKQRVEDEMVDESVENKSKEQLTKEIKNLKQEWVLLMKDYKTLSDLVATYEGKSKQLGEPFSRHMLEEMRSLKEKNDVLSEENRTIYGQAKDRIERLKHAIHHIFGWTIKEKENILEIKSIYAEEGDNPFVIQRKEDGNYMLLDTDEYPKIIQNDTNGIRGLLDLPYPAFFAYTTFFMNEEFSNTFLSKEQSVQINYVVQVLLQD